MLFKTQIKTQIINYAINEEDHSVANYVVIAEVARIYLHVLKKVDRFSLIPSFNPVSKISIFLQGKRVSNLELVHGQPWLYFHLVSNLLPQATNIE